MEGTKNPLLGLNPFGGMTPLKGFSFKSKVSTNLKKTQEQHAKRKNTSKEIIKHGDDRFIPFVDWTEKNFYDPTTVNQYGKDWDFTGAKLIKWEPFQKDIFNKVLTPDENGIFPYETIVWSTIKKEGKTTGAGAVGAWWGACNEPPNKILTLANDQEQSAGRIFGAMLPTLYALGCKVPLAQSSKPEVRLQNGTLIQAIANNYAGAAGDNYGLTLWSELWAYTTERSRRLYDELIPVPTRKNSLRWIETYVGFEDESELLLKLFKRIFIDTDEKYMQPKAKPVPGLEHIQSDGRPSCWHIPEERLFYYHNHEPRMPWNVGDRGEKYRAAQKADLRHSQYVRLHENRWQSSEGSFIDPDWIPETFIYPGQDLSQPMFFCGDASMRHDTTALLGVRRIDVPVFGKIQERYKVCYVKIWDPEGKDIDLEETIANKIYGFFEQGLMIGPFYYDNFQMHQIAINLRKKGVPCVEFQQHAERTRSDTFLWKQFHLGRIGMFRHDDLKDHIIASKAKELGDEQIRIVKGKGNRSSKIDGCVSLSMAIWRASQYRPQDHDQTQTSSTTTQ